MKASDRKMDGFIASIKRMLRMASVEKGRVDKEYDDSLAALDAWKKEQEGRLDAAERRLKDWNEAIDVPSPVEEAIARMENEKQKALDLKLEIDAALAKP